MVTAFLLTNWRALVLVAAVAAVLITASALLTTCDTRQPQELSGQAERRVKAKFTNARTQARADSVRARQALAHAAVALDSAHVYRDSLLYYQRHETDIIHVAPADTARVQRFLADYFDL